MDTWRNREATCVPKNADRQTAFRFYIVESLVEAVNAISRICNNYYQHKTFFCDYLTLLK